MKKFTYQFSQDDIKTLTSTLAILIESLPYIDEDILEDDIKALCFRHGTSAIERFFNMESRISNNELSATHISLQYVHGILYGDFPADDSIRKLCSELLFGVQKLLPVFDEHFS